MDEISIRIEGMYCDNCSRTVARAISGVAGVSAAQMEGDVARVSFDGPQDIDAVVAAVVDAGYFTDASHVLGANAASGEGAARMRAAGTFALLVAGIALLGWAVNALAGYNVFNAIPVIDSSLSYGMLFVTGLLTGLHCLSMCGAVNLAATAADAFPAKRDLSSPLLYNAGRLVSYTALGALAGLLGGVIGIDRRVSTVLIVAAGAVMVAMALRMAGIVSFKVPLPSAFERARAKTSRTGAPLLIGLVNGFMPCGPLQAMQLYALGTGSAAAGALSMFLFCLGTIPFMLAIGYAANVLGGRGRAVVAKVAAAFMFVLAVSMVSRGLSIGGVNVSLATTPLDDAFIEAEMVDGVQVARFDLQWDGYADVVLRAGMPARIVVDADAGKLTGCNNEILMEEWGVDAKLSPGENVIEFTPETAGEYAYTCWMNMLVNRVRVVD